MVTAPGNTALDIADHASKGGTMPKVVHDFIKRTTDSNQGPLTYEEARQFYSNASSRLSAEEAQRLAPQAKRLLSQFTSDLGGAIQQTADQAGRLQDYLDAMSEYRSAARLGSWSKAANRSGQGFAEKGSVDPCGLRRRPQIYAVNAKRKGTRNEPRSILLLESAGYACTGAAASLGVFDIVGISPTDVVLVRSKTRYWPSAIEMEAIRNFQCPRPYKKIVHRYRDQGTATRCPHDMNQEERNPMSHTPR